MGREIRRVPLDFDWPLNETWEGSVNPHGKQCPAAAENMCFGGETPARKWLNAVAQLVGLITEEAEAEPNADVLRARGRVFPHPYLTEWPIAPRCEERFDDGALGRPVRYPRVLEAPPPLVPFTEELAELARKLVGEEARSIVGFNSYLIAARILRAAGLDAKTWGVCKVCDGTGIDPATREAYEAWTPTPPPTGPGWQLWTDVNDSPISAVFPDETAFRQYLLIDGASPEAVERFIQEGWHPTARATVAEGDVTFRSGIESAGNDA